MPYAVIFWAFSPTNRNYPGAISKNGINGESVKQIPREAYKISVFERSEFPRF